MDLSCQAFAKILQPLNTLISCPSRTPRSSAPQLATSIFQRPKDRQFSHYDILTKRAKYLVHVKSTSGETFTRTLYPYTFDRTLPLLALLPCHILDDVRVTSIKLKHDFKS